MEIRSHRSIKEIPKDQWNRLSPFDFPFADYDYFLALEESGSVGGETGWEPVYLVAYRKSEIVGASYLYLKRHSYGEYIFDWAWAEAYQRHKVLYYPKVLSAIPFTPATGPKLLGDDDEVSQALIQASLKIV